ncbi:hypothetical protein ATANTOWER_031907 [Ataeniobius toweri]|uniref:Uncharacterized protein n=1 Tax=Ataeniobius toweri TaxID=208326 RepID=A0ABU7BTV3_9TELE|nr:hypothetical protein [Ataeniobius toweri]
MLLPSSCLRFGLTRTQNLTYIRDSLQHQPCATELSQICSDQRKPPPYINPMWPGPPLGRAEVRIELNLPPTSQLNVHFILYFTDSMTRRREQEGKPFVRPKCHLRSTKDI